MDSLGKIIQGIKFPCSFDQNFLFYSAFYSIINVAKTRSVWRDAKWGINLNTLKNRVPVNIFGWNFQDHLIFLLCWHSYKMEIFWRGWEDLKLVEISEILRTTTILSLAFTYEECKCNWICLCFLEVLSMLILKIKAVFLVLLGSMDLFGSENMVWQ